MTTVRARRPVSARETKEIWDRYRRGESISSIARALGRDPALVHDRVSANGGIRNNRVDEPRRSPNNLSLAEREVISRGIARDLSLRDIATELRRAPSTISREVNRNGGRAAYRAATAESCAENYAARPKDWKFDQCPRLQRLVATKLAVRWSPQQISGWLKRTYPGDPSMNVSHETIYRSLFIQTRGLLKKELLSCLRASRRYRVHKRGAHVSHRGAIVDGLSIRQRPAEASDRAVPGHWEGDLLLGDPRSCIATLVERTSRFTMLVRLPSKQSSVVTAALAKHIQKIPTELRRSLTWDRGTELAKHKQLALAANLKVYFCDPHSPWQRGSNENTNGLLRQYFPKGQSISHVTQTELNAVARELNQRPRQTLDFRSPAEFYSSFVAQLG